MINKLFSLALLILCGQSLRAQSLDIVIFRHLLTADKEEFLTYAKSARFITSYDTVSETLFANTEDCLYAKPTGTKNDNENYALVLIVSTRNKDNNKLILKNAREAPNQKGFWTDNEYLYGELDMENPISKVMWYKVLIYKKK